MLVAGDVALDVPAAFVSVTVIAFVPSPRLDEGWNVHVPSVPTVVEPICVPLSNTLMMSPAVPVPLMCGCESAVPLPAAMAAPLSSVRLGATGVAGTLVSTTTLIGAEGVLGVPAGFVSITVMLLVPSGKFGEGVNDHSPFDGIMSEPIGVPLSYTVMVSPAVPVPLMVGCGSFVEPPATIAVPASFVITGATGVAGTLVSTTTLIGAEGVLGVPAGFVSITVILLLPSGRFGDGVNDHSPFAGIMSEPIDRKSTRLNSS